MSLFLYLLFSFTLVSSYQLIENLEPEKCNSTYFSSSVPHACTTFKCANDSITQFNAKLRVYECIKCDESNTSFLCSVKTLICEKYDYKVFEFDGNETIGRCMTCPLWYQPNAEKTSCVPCSTTCHCPKQFIDFNGTCVEASDVATLPNSPSLYMLSLHGKYFSSGYFRDHVQTAALKCKTLGPGSYCQQLANLCALMDYNFDTTSACSFHRQLSNSFSIPSTYYDEATNHFLLNSERIPVFKEQLVNLVVKRFSLEGLYEGIQPLQSVFDSLCCANDWPTPMRTNTNQRQSCRLNSHPFEKHHMFFYELYIIHKEANKTKLINIPLRVASFTRGGNLRNQDNDVSRWQLTKRFFNIDVVSGSKQQTGIDFVRYLSSLSIRLSLVPDEEPPVQRVPYATIEYRLENLDDKRKIQTILFNVEYTVRMDHAIYSVKIALSVLSSLAAVYSLFFIRIWYQRSAKATVDLMTLVRFVIYAGDVMANVISLVVFFATFYWLVTFRQQDEVIISLPYQRDELLIKELIISAFVLKAVGVLWMVYEQCSVGVFMIDWEHPRPSTGDVVSVWRMYFVANEWNEIQTSRKSSISLQIILVLFILKVEQYAMEVPSGYSNTDSSSSFNSILQFALGATTYLCVNILQNVFNAVIFERFYGHKIQQFVDLCTLSNISVWLLQQQRYGFYIHGRSPHGFSDTDMLTMCGQLQREEENLCAQRGLVQGQDVQTFSIGLNNKLSLQFQQLLQNDGNKSTTQSALSNLNKFLASFLDHAIREIDYEICERHYVEKLLGFEFLKHPAERTIFYNDGSTCFDRVLFYGNEATLVVFDVLLFSLTSTYCKDYLAAALTTFLIAKLIESVRYQFGRKNLARKTGIDARFLF